MRELFNMDNAFFRALSRLADLMILNLAFLFFSIPVVTIGASLTALYYVALKIAENEEGYILRSFWKSFRQNFKQATVIWLAVLAVGIVLFLDFQIMKGAEGPLAKVINVGIIAVTFLYLMTVSYIFPVLSRFFNTIRGTFKNAVLMAIANLPFTALILIVSVAPFLVTLYNGYTLWYGLLVWILAGFSLIAYVNSMMFKRIFAKFMPPKEEENEDPDHWEVEEISSEAADPEAVGIIDAGTDGSPSQIDNTEPDKDSTSPDL